MATVTVNRLRIGERPERVGAAIFALEDALRTELPATDRLILVRRMVIRGDRSPDRRRIQADAVRKAYAHTIANACHGSTSGAADANCVWFQNVDEARRLLLAALLAGHHVAGWHWALAVPDWRHRPLDQWVEDLLQQALQTRNDNALLLVVESFVAAGAIERLLALLAPSTHSDLPPPGVSSPTASMADLTKISDHPSGATASSPITASPSIIIAILEALPLSLRDLLHRLAQGTSPAARSVMHRLLDAAILRISPALALNQRMRSELIEQAAGHLPLSALPPTPDLADKTLSRAAQWQTPISEHSPIARLWRKQPQPIPNSHGIVTPHQPEPCLPHAVPSANTELISPPLTGQPSRSAGLWLVLPSLIQMGFREWLADGGAPLEQDPGRSLLRHIARRHRVEQVDPTWLRLLSPIPDPEDALVALWFEQWRRGLDGWLRRRARVTLHDLIHRRGWLHAGEERLTIRYPLAAADIRLRRHALDVDPGWVDWLGFSLRYRFSDDPLP